tara:strand:- start:1330 stop:2196 length:867 start_codon:yes stop_codon:yes gene_type:complete
MNLLDIRQGRNGDCFILSSIGSIFSSLGEQFINKIINTDNNKIEFNYYSKNDSTNSTKLQNIFEKRKIEYIYSEDEYKISKKCKTWVKKIEYAYIKTFYNNDINSLLNNGGLAYNVLEHLTGYKSKIIINRLFDNKEELYYETCKKRLNNKKWKNDFIKHLDIISNKYITIIQNKIWDKLTDQNNLIRNTLNKIKIPCVIGIQGHYNKKNINGIIYGHLYSIIGISIDNYNNRFIHVFNPHHNVDARKTYYDNINNTFISDISIDNYGIWALDEIIVFMSDLTYTDII